MVLNADVVGYSVLISDDFESTTAMMERYRHLVDSKIARSDGTLIDFVEDNFKAAFEDAGYALQTAIAIPAEIEIANAELRGPQTIF